MVFGLSFLFFCCGILGRKWKSCTPVYLLQPERRNDERLCLFLSYISCVLLWVSLKCIAQLGHLEYIFFHSHLRLKFLHLLDVWYFLIKFVYIPTNIDNTFGTKLHQKWIAHLWLEQSVSTQNLASVCKDFCPALQVDYPPAFSKYTLPLSILSLI